MKWPTELAKQLYSPNRPKPLAKKKPKEAKK